MRQVLILASFVVLSDACTTGGVVLDPSDSGPPDVATDAPSPAEDAFSLPLCAERPRLLLSYFTGTSPEWFLRVEPPTSFGGTVTVLSVEHTEVEQTLVVDDAGTERTIVILEPAWPLDVAVGETVILQSYGVGMLAVRDEAGDLISLYVRRVFTRDPSVGLVLDADLDWEPVCYIPGGGQCGRGFFDYQLVDSSRTFAIRPGESGVVPSLRGSIEISLLQAHDDNYIPPEGACVIGLAGALFLDARPIAPTGP